MEPLTSTDVTAAEPIGRHPAVVLPFQRPSMPPVELIDRYFERSRAVSWYSNGGPCHELLVERTCALLGHRPVVPVSSAGVGLVTALRALVPVDSRARQVVVPSFTFAATVAAIVWCGLEPVFCDIEPDGWHLCPARLHDVLADRQGEVAAVLACSTFGTPPPPDVAASWRATTEEWAVPLLVDAAAGFGASEWPSHAPDAEIFSMHATKPLAIGEGGLVAFAAAQHAATMRTLVNHGIDASHEVVAVGLNGKLDEWHAATALAALDVHAEHLARRRGAAAAMRDELRSTGLRFQARAERSPGQFVPALATSPAHRALILERAADFGVELRTYFSPLHRSPAYRRCDRADDLDVTTDVAGRILSLPMSDRFTEAEQLLVSTCVRG